ncbi:SET domain-containing protein [Ramicandelaber brevisporus]|nr:SET domain-containing protein [Ramicandelaber brevisporus]
MRHLGTAASAYDSSSYAALNGTSEQQQQQQHQKLAIRKQRGKRLRFGFSSIHDIGLYAAEPIAAGELVVEYVGEIVRCSLLDKLEHQYQMAGIGDFYLWRVNEVYSIDATLKGNLARFINHSCMPNCSARDVEVPSASCDALSFNVCIYAERPIEVGEEITYDYHLRSDPGHESVRCRCGTIKCKTYL